MTRHRWSRVHDVRNWIRKDRLNRLLWSSAQALLTIIVRVLLWVWLDGHHS